ncbi:transposase [Halobacteriales archaeon SW_5_70_135]|nr:MAG: transposase [Halobacteriales archaeon SW_5_70_135]
MEVRRTVPVKLDVTDSDAALLHDTIDQFRDAANYVVRHARDDDGYVITSKRRLHDRTYEDVREATDLHANLVQAARSRAAEALKSVVAKWKRGKKASLPRFTSPFLEYDQRSATFNDDHASLSTVGGRITAEYVLPGENHDTPHSQYLLSEDYETTGATLHYREPAGEFYLHVRTKADVDAPEPPENGTVLGVDLGVKNIAVTSTGVFWSGDELNHWHREYEKRRASMQQKGTRSAHEAMKRVGETETGRFEQLFHRVANGIVREAVEGGCSHIAFEDLTGIRDRMPGAKRLHEWAFRRLYEYVAYRAKERGVAVKQVDPQYTSQRCSRTGCGFTHPDNRPSQDSFCCQKCGYKVHADYNAAKNVGFKILRSLHKSSDGDAPVGVRINTGTLNTSGFTTAPDSVRVGVHGESPAL